MVLPHGVRVSEATHDFRVPIRLASWPMIVELRQGNGSRCSGGVLVFQASWRRDGSSITTIAISFMSKHFPLIN